MNQGTAEAPLRVSRLNKIFGSGPQAVHAVRDVSFALAPGEFVAIVGPSGSGKTTLLAMIGGLLTPTSGNIEVYGKSIATFSSSQLSQYRRTSVGYVFQANNLVPFLTTRENLLIANSVSKRFPHREAMRRAEQLLDELGLSDRAEALATELSGGERQRAAIARALMNDPLVILVDEPTASLDSARGRQVVTSLMKEVKDRNKLGIMVTHDMDMARLTDRVLELHDGELRRDIAPSQIDL